MELDIDRLAAALHARQASVFKAVVESCAEDTEITAETAADIGRDAEAAYKEAVRTALIEFGWTPDQKENRSG